MGAVQRPWQFSNTHMMLQRHITPNMLVTFAQVQLPPGNTKVNSSHLCRVLDMGAHRVPVRHTSHKMLFRALSCTQV